MTEELRKVVEVSMLVTGGAVPVAGGAILQLVELFL
jgi:hypothetical protein